MKTTITKWGNSLAVRIPKPFARQAGIEKEDQIEIVIKENKIIVSKQKPSLKNLLKNINKDNIHKETSTGGKIGKEIW